MRIAKFDLDTYLRTKDLSGGPIYAVVEEKFPEIEMFTDEHGLWLGLCPDGRLCRRHVLLPVVLYSRSLGSWKKPRL